MPKKKVIISGYYGFNSVGDEAILLALIEALKGEMPSAQICVLSFDPLKTRLDFGVESIKRTDFFKLIKTMRRADLFISGGGGLFQDIFRLNSVLYYGGLIILARIFCPKVAIYSQGVGPLKSRSARFLTRLAFSLADLIIVRDPESKSLLSEIGVRKEITVSADPVFGLDLSAMTVSADDSKKPVIGISARNWASLDASRFADLADGLASELGAKIIFIPMKYPKDLIFAGEITKMMVEKAIIFDNPSPPATFEVISGLDFLVALPLHSLIMAAKAKVPFFAITYDPKVENFLKLLNHRSATSIEAFNSEEVINQARLSLGGGGSQLASCPKVDSLSQKARLAPPLIKSLLEKSQVLGLKIDALSFTEAVASLGELIKKSGSHLAITLNTEMAILAQNDKDLAFIINQADLVLPDSFGIKWAARLKEKVTGVDLVDALCAYAAQNGFGVAFFGSGEGVAALAAGKLAQKYPKLIIHSTYSGFISQGEEEEMVERYKIDPPDILFVGLGIPKQEKWLAANQEALKISLAMGVGGSFDVISGRAKRAPLIIQRMNLEWLYRLLSEPKKRFKRVFGSLPKFVYLIIKDRYSHH